MNLGETGEYPYGKLNEDDEGQKMRERNPPMRQLEDLVMAELHEMSEKPPIQVEMSGILAYMLISQCQIAARHPNNVGPSRDQVRDFLESLESQICKPGSAVAVTIEMGWNGPFEEGD
jgi:hypothetical protein